MNHRGPILVTLGRLRGLTGVLLLAWAWLSGRAAEPPDPRAVLTNVAQIRQLGPAALRNPQPVRLRGVVTYHDPDWSLLFAQDATGGIYVRVPTAELPLARGQLVEISGRTALDGFTPCVDWLSMRVLEPSAPPVARLVSLREFQSGAHDGRRVELAGVVRAVGQVFNRLLIHIHTGPDDVDVILRDPAPNDPRMAALVGARVRVRGVCATERKADGQPREARLLVPSLDDLMVESPAPAPSYDTPPTTIAALRALSSAAEERLRIRGVITQAVSNQVMTVRDETGSIDVQTEGGTPTQAGDWVEAFGFRGGGPAQPVLEHAVYRVRALKQDRKSVV